MGTVQNQICIKSLITILRRRVRIIYLRLRTSCQIRFYFLTLILSMAQNHSLCWHSTNSGPCEELPTYVDNVSLTCSDHNTAILKWVSSRRLTCYWSWCSKWGPCSPAGRALWRQPGSWWALFPLGCTHRAGQSLAMSGCPSWSWSPDTCPWNTFIINL